MGKLWESGIFAQSRDAFNSDVFLVGLSSGFVLRAFGLRMLMGVLAQPAKSFPVLFLGGGGWGGGGYL